MANISPIKTLPITSGRLSLLSSDVEEDDLLDFDQLATEDDLFLLNDEKYVEYLMKDVAEWVDSFSNKQTISFDNDSDTHTPTNGYSRFEYLTKSISRTVTINKGKIESNSNETPLNTKFGTITKGTIHSNRVQSNANLTYDCLDVNRNLSDENSFNGQITPSGPNNYVPDKNINTNTITVNRRSFVRSRQRADSSDADLTNNVFFKRNSTFDIEESPSSDEISNNNDLRSLHKLNTTYNKDSDTDDTFSTSTQLSRNYPTISRNNARTLQQRETSHDKLNYSNLKETQFVSNICNDNLRSQQNYHLSEVNGNLPDENHDPNGKVTSIRPNDYISDKSNNTNTITVNRRSFVRSRPRADSSDIDLMNNVSLRNNSTFNVEESPSSDEITNNNDLKSLHKLNSTYNKDSDDSLSQPTRNYPTISRNITRTLLRREASQGQLNYSNPSKETQYMTSTSNDDLLSSGSSTVSMKSNLSFASSLSGRSEPSLVGMHKNMSMAGNAQTKKLPNRPLVFNGKTQINSKIAKPQNGIAKKVIASKLPNINANTFGSMNSLPSQMGRTASQTAVISDLNQEHCDIDVNGSIKVISGLGRKSTFRVHRPTAIVNVASIFGDHHHQSADTIVNGSASTAAKCKSDDNISSGLSNDMEEFRTKVFNSNGHVRKVATNQSKANPKQSNSQLRPPHASHQSQLQYKPREQVNYRSESPSSNSSCSSSSSSISKLTNYNYNNHSKSNISSAFNRKPNERHKAALGAAIVNRNKLLPYDNNNHNNNNNNNDSINGNISLNLVNNNYHPPPHSKQSSTNNNSCTSLNLTTNNVDHDNNDYDDDHDDVGDNDDHSKRTFTNQTTLPSSTNSTNATSISKVVSSSRIPALLKSTQSNRSGIPVSGIPQRTATGLYPNETSTLARKKKAPHVAPPAHPTSTNNSKQFGQLATNNHQLNLFQHKSSSVLGAYETNGGTVHHHHHHHQQRYNTTVDDKSWQNDCF